MGGIRVPTRRQAVVGLSAVLVLLLVPGINLPPGRWLHAFWDLFHAPFFFGITCLFYRLLPEKGRRVRRVLVAAVLALVAGGLVEGLQGFTGRSASLKDFLINVVGISLAVTWLLWGARTGKTGMLRFGLIAAIALWFCLWPAWSMTMAEALHRRKLPDIGAFSDWSGRRLWRAQGNAVVEFPKGQHRMKVAIGEGDFGGLSFRPGAQDWSMFATVELSIFNPGAPFQLGIRIDDSNSQRDASWYSTAAEVVQGANRLLIPLPERSKSSDGTGIDFSKVARLALFTVGEIESREFFVDSAFLLP